MLESIAKGERVVMGADFNGQVEEGNRGYEEEMGRFGIKETWKDRQWYILQRDWKWLW